MIKERWIGPVIDTDGEYETAFTYDLLARKITDKYPNRVYRFETKARGIYRITEPAIVQEIENIAAKGEIDVLYKYLYILVIETFGIGEFISDIEKTIAYERQSNFTKGMDHAKSQMRIVLGIE